MLIPCKPYNVLRLTREEVYKIHSIEKPGGRGLDTIKSYIRVS